MNIKGLTKRMKCFLFMGAVLVCSLVFIACSGRFDNHADAASNYRLRCKSVQIAEGDSLWSIAEEFYTPECGSMKEYIKEIKRTNSLSSDTIHSGHYLLIPYYSLNE